MLHLHHADRLEPLLDALAELLAVPPADPFEADVVAVPAAGMEDAVKVGLARRLGTSAPGAADGVTANVQFLFPGQLVARALGDPGVATTTADPWRLPELTWWVLQELSVTSLPIPGRSSNGDGWWALARRIADLFDRYATQRPRLIQEWAAGRALDGTLDAHGQPAGLLEQHLWQFQFWTALRSRIGAPGPAERLPGLLEAITDGSVQPALPARVALFGVGGVPPSMFEVLRALGHARDVHVFLRHPSHVAWAASQNALRGSLSLRDRVDVAVHTHHPLLASWARPSLEVRALVGGATGTTDRPEGVAEVDTSPSTVLAAIQSDIRADRAPFGRTTLEPADGSFQVHACHGVARQLEVVRDALGHAFATDHTLQPHEVLVLCPDLERVAPLVESVLGRGGLPVPVRIGDRSLTTEDPIAGVVHSVLTLVSSRATLSEVLALLQYEPLRARFGWTLEDVERVAQWCSSLGTRWGLTAERRPDWGVDAEVGTGTWQRTVDQLLAGMAMPAPSPRAVAGDVAPFDDLATDEYELAGGLADLLARLIDLHGRAVGSLDAPVAAPMGEWVPLLHDVVDGFCAVRRDDQWRLRAMHRQIDTLAECAAAAGSTVRLSLADVRTMLGDAFSDRPGRLPLRSGAVTVSSLVPQHGVPARVICLVGLDEGTLRGTTFDGDDVLGVHPCVGERHPRYEGRQLLLDALLAATDRCIVTCDGADVTSNKEIPFVVPLAELLDVVRSTVVLRDGDAPVVVRHPRHGFNERALTARGLWQGTDGAFTFDNAMLDAAVAQRAAAEARRAGAADALGAGAVWSLPAAHIAEVTVDDLVRALTRPAEVLLRDRLDLGALREGSVPDDHLPITVEGRQLSALGGELLRERRLDHPVASWREVAELDGTLPPGALSSAALDDLTAEVALFESTTATWSLPLGPGDGSMMVDLSLGADDQHHAVSVGGALTGLHSGAPVPTISDVRFAKDRPSFRLALAVRLAVLQLLHPDQSCQAVLIPRRATDRESLPTYALTVAGDGDERQAHAAAYLRMAVQLHAWAMRDAVPFFDQLGEAFGTDKRSYDTRWRTDRFDDAVRLLWGHHDVASLLALPVEPTDPEPVRAQAAAGRAVATSRWVWDAYREHFLSRSSLNGKTSGGTKVAR